MFPCMLIAFLFSLSGSLVQLHIILYSLISFFWLWSQAWVQQSIYIVIHKQFTWSCLALVWIRTWNCVGSLWTKVKGSPAHFLRPQFKLTCWHQTSIILISGLWSDPDKPTARQDLELGSNLPEKSLSSSCPSFYIILYYYLMSRLLREYSKRRICFFIITETGTAQLLLRKSSAYMQYVCLDP